MEGPSSSSFETLKNKKLKSQKVDRISAFPDPIIHHILLFLPSTKEAIRTSVLSKRWKNNWCGVPNLIFYSTGMPDELSRVFIDTTIIQYGPYNIKKFHMQLDGQNVDNDLHLREKIHFPMRRQVEELIFEFPNSAIMLPRRCLFHHAPLIKLQTLGCILAPSEGVNWEFLKELNMERCRSPDIALEDIFFGSPSLESLRITVCFGFSRLVVKSTSLKKLELGYLHEISLLEISCPNLEQFNLHGSLDITSVNFTNLSSLIHADLDFEHDGDFLEESLTKKILEQLQHVKELTFGRHVMEVLSYVWYYRPYLSRLSLNITCLTLGSPEFCEFNDGIEYVLLSSPFLEKLVITKDFFYEDDFHVPYILHDRGGYFWNYHRTDFDCLVGHLKLVQVVGLPESDYDYTYVLDFIGFVLRTARVLEKVVVTLEGGGKYFQDEVSEILLSFPRRSANAVVEVLGSQ